MMLLSIFGIIWVQIVWIRNAINIRNESFNNAVFVSLTNAANTIESSRKLNFFNNFVLDDPSLLNSQSQSSSNYLSINSYSSDSGSNLSLKISNQSFPGGFDKGNVTIGNKSFSINADTTIVSNSDTLIVSANGDPGKMDIVTLGKDLNTNSRAFYIRQSEFLDWVRKRSNEFQNMSDQIISEIYQWEKTLELDNKEIEYSLKQSLSFAGIQTPFEYAIVKDGIVQDYENKNKWRSQSYKIPQSMGEGECIPLSVRNFGDYGWDFTLIYKVCQFSFKKKREGGKSQVVRRKGLKTKRIEHGEKQRL